MVIVVESMLPVEGKGTAAMELLRRAAKYVKETFGIEAQVLRRETPRVGENQRLLAMLTFDSLGAWGEYQETVEKDTFFQQLVEDGFRGEEKCFVYNSVSRTIFKVLE